jgi:hypothetical protein
MYRKSRVSSPGRQERTEHTELQRHDANFGVRALRRDQRDRKERIFARSRQTNPYSMYLARTSNIILMVHAPLTYGEGRGVIPLVGERNGPP